MSKFAWVTLTTNDTYSLGSLVLANSLRRVGTEHQLAVLITPGVSESMRERLREAFDVVQEVNVLDSQDAANLALLARPELGITFTKLHAWRLLQFEKCVFLDSDTLVVQNSDELFEREELSAAPDVSWPDCFNSGVFVYQPSLETFNSLIEFALKNGSFDGGDQGLLNLYFSDWATTDIRKHLPFTYNVAAYASYTYLPAFKQFRDKIKILHFAGKLKPWLIQFDTQSRTARVPTDYAHAADFIQLWWNIFYDKVQERLTDQMNLLTNFRCHNLTTVLSEKFPKTISGDIHCVQNEFNDMKHSFHDPWEEYYKKSELIVADMPLLQNEIKTNEIAENANNHISHFETKEVEPNALSSYRDTNSDQNAIDQIDKSNDASEYVNTVAESCQHNDSTETDQYDLGLEANVPLLIIENQNNKISTKDDSNIDCECLKDETGNLEVDKAGLAGALSQLRLGVERTPEQDAYEQLMRRQCWESGQIDYSGRDSFDNVWRKITQTLGAKPTPSAQDPSGSS